MVSSARLASFAVVALALAARAALPAPPTLAPDQLRAGQKAVVRTVFAGDRVEEFEAEIVGVLKSGRAAGETILAKATSERVIQTGIAQGMSGSPVYVDGKLVGALSSGWSFSREPLFGITPIGEMLEVLDLPRSPEGSEGTVGPTGLEPPMKDMGYRGLLWRDPPPEPAAPHGGAAAPRASLAATSPAPLSIPVACLGLAPAALPIAQRVLDPLGLAAVPGGKTGASETAATLEPGSAVAVDLLRGDLQMAAIGTVTWREGNQILIFGHPLFQSGPVKLPLSSAEITTVVASQLTSFKIGSSGRPLGVATQDRRAAVAGRIGEIPRLMPVSVRIEGSAAAPRAFRFESIEDRALAPQLIGLATLNSLLESGGVGSGQAVRWHLTLHRHRAPALELADVATGSGLVPDLMGGIAQPLAFLYNNPFQSLALDSVAIRLRVEPGLDLWTLRAVQVSRPVVRPGGVFKVRCELEQWRGGRRAIEVAVRVPEEVPEGRYVVWAGGGTELNRFEALRLPGRYRPASLDEAWRRIGAMRANDRLYVTLLARAPEVTRQGRDYPELPTSALALLSSGSSAEDATRRGTQAILDEVRQPLDGHVNGEVQLEVTVDPDAP